MASDVTLKYAAAATVTISPGTLASSATAGRQSAVVDNATDLYIDALLACSFTLTTGTIGNDKAVSVYAYAGGILDASSTYSGSASGSDAAYTFTDPTDLKLLGQVPFVAQSTTKISVFSVAAAFGGILPPRWGICVKNFTGIALVTGATVKFVGIKAATT